MKVGVFVQCFNEMSMLPWFIRFYRAMIPGVTICVMNNESTDGTAEYAASQGCQVHTFTTGNTLDDLGRPRLKESARVLMPGMDWIINVDTDEFLVISAQQLEEELRVGTSLLLTRGMSMCGDSTAEDFHDLDVFAIAKGFEDVAYSKPCCYRPELIAAMNYVPGCHFANPMGTVVKSSTVYDLYHFHYLGEAFIVKRYRIFDARNNKKYGCGIQYTSNAVTAAKAYHDNVSKGTSQTSIASRLESLGIKEGAAPVLVSIASPRAATDIVIPSRHGGVGNQMFEIAAAYVYAVECNKQLRIEKTVVHGHHATSEYCTSIFKGFTIHVNENLQDCSFTALVQHRAFDKWLCEAKPGNVRMQGFFQYYPPILRHETAIRQMFTDGLSDVDTSDIPPKAVAIHVRRGDYLVSDIHYLQTPEYYRHAMTLFPDATEFIVFSDDLEWCKAQAVFSSPKCSFIDEPDEVRALSKIAAAKGGMICANSTFSWWAAFLGPHSIRSPVVVPASRWIAIPVVDLFPREWIRL